MAQPSSHSVGGHSSPSASTTRGHHAYHPYHAPQSITFVDASQQAEAASRGEGPTDMQCKPKRKRILPGQLERLLEVFEVTDTPSYDVRERLSAVRSPYISSPAARPFETDPFLFPRRKRA